jgi:hypothetical protein
MLTLAPLKQNPTRWLGLLAALLVLLVTLGLIALFWHGAPSRTLLCITLLVLLATPILLRWQSGWMVVFAVFPLVNGFRRVYLIYDADKIIGGFNDPLSIFPDLLLGFMVVGYLVNLRRNKRPPNPLEERRLAVPLTFLMLLSVVEIFNPHMGSIPCGVNGFRVFTLWVFLYFMTRDLVTSRQQINQWMVITLLLGTLTGLYGAYQYVFGFPWYDTLWANIYNVSFQTVGDSMRAFSTFSFTSTFSHYMAIGCCVGLVALRKRDMGPFINILSPFFLGAMLLGLAFTFVRSSYAGLLFAGVVGLIMSGSPKGRGQRLLLTFVLAFVVLQLVPKSSSDLSYTGLSDGQLVSQRVMTLAEPAKVGSMGARFGAWQGVLNNAFKYPFGVGIGAGGGSRFNGNGDIASMAYTESQYFSELAELGWVGLALFLWVVVYGFLYSIRTHDALQDPDLKRVARMSLMIQVAILTAGLTGGTVLYSLPGGAYYWTCLGLMGALRRLDSPARSAEAA